MARSVEAVLKRYLRHLPALLGVALLIGAIYVVQREFRHLKLADIRVALAAIPDRALVISFGCTIVSYGVLTFYDRLGTMYAGTRCITAGSRSHRSVPMRCRITSVFRRCPVRRCATGCIRIGDCRRCRSPRWWGSAASPSGWAGWYWAARSSSSSHDRYRSLAPCCRYGRCGSSVARCGAWFAAYIVVSRVMGTITFRGHSFNLPDWRMAIVQVALASLDVAVTAAIFYALLPPTPGLTYLHFLAVYLASYSAGLLTNLPGGIGVFDTAMLLGLEPYLSAPEILGGILVFRLVLLRHPAFPGRHAVRGQRNPAPWRRAAAWGCHRPPPAVADTDERAGFRGRAATGAVAMCGALLLSLGVLDARPDFSWIDPDFTDHGRECRAVRSLADRCGADGDGDRAFAAGDARLGGDAGLAAAGRWADRSPGDDLWIPAVLVLAALLVAPFRDAFYRHARLLTGPLHSDVLMPLIGAGGLRGGTGGVRAGGAAVGGKIAGGRSFSRRTCRTVCAW